MVVGLQAVTLTVEAPGCGRDGVFTLFPEGCSNSEVSSPIHRE